MSASAGLSALTSMLGLTKRRDVGKQEAIEGQVRVTTAKKDGPDFGDLKLSQCLQVRRLHCLSAIGHTVPAAWYGSSSK